MGLPQDNFHDISKIYTETFDDDDIIIFTSSSIGRGKMQPDWAEFQDELENIDFSDKTVTFVGMGNQIMFPDSYLDGIAHLHNLVVESKRVIDKNLSGEEYDFEYSGFLKRCFSWTCLG